MPKDDRKSSMSCRWVFTINNPTPEDQAALERLNTDGLIKYLVYGEEVGAEDHTPHYQGYVIMAHNSRLAGMKKLLPRAHLEIAKGDPLSSGAYCRKDGHFHEYGTRPKTPKEAGSTDWDIARKAAKEGRFEDIPSHIYIRYRSNLRAIRSESQVVPEPLTHMEFYWYWGPTGCGKTYTARMENPGHYLKLHNKWWDGFSDQPCVIIDEWSPHASKELVDLMKQWCDIWPFPAETKNGTTCIRPKKIIVTSNYTIQDCFGPSQDVLPLLRRFTVRHFNVPYVAPSDASVDVGLAHADTLTPAVPAEGAPAPDGPDN